jgi:hypothetical protein
MCVAADLYRHPVLYVHSVGTLYRRRGRVMAKVRRDLRLDEELAAWVDAYAEERSSSRTEIVEVALRALRDLASGGVPDLAAGDAPARRADLARARANPRVEAARRLPNIKTAAEVREDPARQAAMVRMAKLRGQ